MTTRTKKEVTSSALYFMHLNFSKEESIKMSLKNYIFQSNYDNYINNISELVDINIELSKKANIFYHQIKLK
jgi:hypothetical protein